MYISTNLIKRFFIFSIFAFVFYFSISAIQAQISAVDLTFNAVPEKNSSLTSFILQPDNKIIVFGNFRVANGVLKNQIFRLNPNGDFDNSFDCASCDIAINNAILQPDGKILISGSPLNGTSQAIVYRLNPDGTRDESFVSPFAPNLYAYNSAYIEAIQPDGKILVDLISGSNGGGLRYHYIYRLNSNGSQDNTFTAIAFQGYLSSAEYPLKVVVQPDGKIFLAGNYLSTYGSSGFLRRYNSDGTRDTTYESPTFASNTQPYGLGTINDFDFLADGSLVIAGSFTSINAINRLNVAKILPAGNVDLSFNPTNSFNIGGTGTGIKALAGGKILISTESRFYRFNADGTIDNSFNTPSNLTQIYKWSLDLSGKIVLYGTFSENNASVGKFARLDQNGAVETSFAISFGTNSSITALAAQSDGKVIFAGDFVRVGGSPRISLARVNADGTLDSTFNAGNGYNGTISKILIQSDNKILIVGDFYNYNGTSVASFARLNTDGSLDTSFNPIINSVINTAALQADGKILVGGSFTSVNGQARAGIARLNTDGSLDASFNPIFGSVTIRSIIAQTDGKILAGGSFSAVNGFARSNLVRFNVDGSLDVSFNAGSISSVNQIELQTDGKYLVLTNSLVRLNVNGATDSGFTSPTFSGSIYQILAQPDGSIIIGGSFSQINNVSRSNLARLTPNGALDSGFLPTGANAPIRALARQTDSKIVVGGDFSSIGGVTRLSVARLNYAAYRQITPFDFDGDGRADVSVFRPSNGNWFILPSRNNSFYGFPFGASNDKIAPADFDGDGRTDVAVFRDNVAGAGDKAYFYILNSSDNSFRAVQFGTQNDLPLPGDWDGDGKIDLAVYRAATAAGGQSYFYYRPSAQPGVDYVGIAFGSFGDKPLVGDFDGDGRLDPAVFVPATATWRILKSSLNQVTQTSFGLSTDVPVPADYDGDGLANIAVFRPSTGYWYTSQNAANNYGAIQFGATSDLPVPADYDGDGRADVAVFRPSNGVWYLNRTTSGFFGVQFGANGDKPAPNTFIR